MIPDNLCISRVEKIAVLFFSKIIINIFAL